MTMKRLFIIIMLALAVAVNANAGKTLNELHEKCEKVKSLTTVYVSRAMLDMIVNTQPMDEQAKALLSDNIQNVLVVTSELDKGIQFLAKLSNDFTSKNGYETLMQVNDQKENVNVYQKKLSSGLNQYIVSIKGGKESAMIVIEGLLKLEDIIRLTGVMDKDKAKSKLKSAKSAKYSKSPK